MAVSLEEFIAAKRDLLDRLERFVTTDQYRRLQVVASGAADDSQDAWLAEWLISPAFGLGGLPIEIAAKPGGLDVLVTHLKRVLQSAGA